MDKKEFGIYVHIPFCMQKCYYCDFISFAGKENLISNYIDTLKTEIKTVGAVAPESAHVPITTIYIGGGTPSFINSEYIVSILETIRETYSINENAEITIEVNPGTVTRKKLENYKKCGINRISIGLQSTHNNLLKQIGRIHTYEQFLDTYKLAREVGFKNINVDLMLALPNQTIEMLSDSIAEIIKLKPEHISVYSLILEEKTKLYDLVENKKVELPDDNTEREMYWNVKNKLEQNGYKHYEISNFAKEGYASKHNVNCWNQEEYIGFGLAAHSYVNNIRYSNTENMQKYLNSFDTKIIHEKQTIEDKQKEYMMLGLRKIDGVQISEFKNRFVQNPLYVFRKELSKLVEAELVEIDGDNIKLTSKGLDLANLAFCEFA